MRVAIIGGAGRMGAWFGKYFLKNGHEVIISDVRRDKAEAVASSLGARTVENNIRAVKMADLSLISTPIDVTPKVLLEISPELRESMIVAEISSLKSKVLPILRNLAKRGIKVLSLHPLFGSGAQEMVGERIALIPVRDPPLEESLVKDLFPEAEIITVDGNVHDDIMAVTLALTHFINIVFASVVGERDVQTIKQLGGTTFTLQLAISEGVMAEDPMLYASIQIDNENTIKYLERFMSKAVKLKRIIESKNFDEFIKFYQSTRESLSKDEGFVAAYERMYRALRAL